ncbi:MAG: beta-ketoacyl-ACP synthase III [Actinomycetota bacterium]
MSVKITGIGIAVPDRVVTNDEIAQRLGVDPAWIEVRTGIRERRHVGPDESTSTLGARAAEAALACAGRTADEVDVLIVGTCTSDYVFPSTATVIQQAIGAHSAGAFDLGAACSGFIYSLAVGAGLTRGGGAGRVLVVGVDVLSRFTNLDDPITAPLFGDGAGAVMLEADESATPMTFDLRADGSGEDKVLIPAGGARRPATHETVDQRLHTIHMQGREVYRSAVRQMTALGVRLGADGFDLLIAHQANKRIIDETAAHLGVPQEKIYLNIDRYGNTSAASIPIGMHEAWETGRLKPGDRLLLIAFGAGYTYAGAVVPWTLPYPTPALAAAAKPQVPVVT